MREKVTNPMKKDLLGIVLLLIVVACSSPSKVVVLEDKPTPVVPEHLKSPPMGKELYQPFEGWLLGNPK